MLKTNSVNLKENVKDTPTAYKVEPQNKATLVSLKPRIKLQEEIKLNTKTTLEKIQRIQERLEIRGLPPRIDKTGQKQKIAKELQTVTTLKEEWNNIFDDLPTESQEVALEFAKQQLRESKIYKPPPMPTSKEEMKEMGIVPYKERLRQKDGRKESAYDHLERYWGGWLSHFNDKLEGKDYLFQPQLKDLDLALFKGLSNQIRTNPTPELIGKKVNDIIPTISNSIDNMLTNINKEEIDKYQALGQAHYRRNVSPRR